MLANTPQMSPFCLKHYGSLSEIVQKIQREIVQKIQQVFGEDASSVKSIERLSHFKDSLLSVESNTCSDRSSTSSNNEDTDNYNLK